MGRARRRDHQPARRERYRGDVPLPRALAGRGELPDHQARPPGAAHLALELGPHPRPNRHRLHGLRLRPLSAVPRRHPEAADVPGGHPLRTRPPPMLCPALPPIGRPLRHPLEADTGGGTNLCDHEAAPDGHAVPARLTVNEARPGLAMPDVVPSQK